MSKHSLWFPGDDDLCWPDQRIAQSGKIQRSAWQKFVDFVYRHVVNDTGIALEGNFVNDKLLPRGAATVAFDNENQFVNVTRWGLFEDPEDRCVSNLSLEVFFCPISETEAVAGFRLRNIGEPSSFIKAWTEQWLGFCIESHFEPRELDYELVPGFHKSLALWLKSGDVNMRSPAEYRNEQEIEFIKSDLAYHVTALHEANARNGDLKDELDHWCDVAGQAKSWTNQIDEIPETLTNSERWQSFDELEQWASLNTDRITILPRALNEAKKSDYDTPDHVRKALEFLAGAYREGRIGEKSNAEMMQALEKSGTRLAGSVGQSVAGNHGDAYFVSWQGRRRMMDMHLSKGGGRNTRFCMRVYFFWCEETQKAVVGWLPSHLSNSLS